MTHFIALKRNNLVRGTLEHITLASYLFNSPYLLHYNNWSDQDLKCDCMVEDINVWKDWRMYTSVVEMSPARKIERKQYVVLIEKEVPNLVLADSDFSMPDYSDGWTWKRTVTRQVVEGRRWKTNRRRGFTQQNLSCPSSLVVCISIPDPVDCQLPCPPRLPATMSTSTLTVIMPPNTSGQLNRGRALLTSSTSLLSWKAWFHHFHTVAEC